jgi:hypothetical protein
MSTIYGEAMPNPYTRRRHRHTSTKKEDSSNQTQPTSEGSFGSNQERIAMMNQGKGKSVKIKSDAFEKQGLRKKVLEKGIQAYQTAFDNEETESSIFTIIDFELPSSEKRLWVMDVQSGKLLHHEQVSHGKNSDKDHDGYVDKGGLSNTSESKQSNIGLLKTAETYHSTKFNGTSMRMDGLEDGYNDNARDRAIVMHPASYADNKEGKTMGRSHGCPALDPDVSGDIIKTIKNGTLMFQYYPDPNWLKNSEYLK